MAIYKIKKRNGSIEDFNLKKIETAISLAIKSVGGKDFDKINEITEEINKQLDYEYTDKVPNVEQIQDIVESVLIKKGHDQTAKAYITYRQQRKQQRKDKEVTINVGNTMEEYLKQADRRVNENANQGYCLGGMILNTYGKISANYRLSHVYPENIGNAHRNGDYHIHDLSMFAPYCAGWSLRALLEEGFNGLNNRVQSAPPKNLQAAINQMINFLGTLQNERAGAQAFSSFDTYLAPFVHKRKKELSDFILEINPEINEESLNKQVNKRLKKYVKQQLQNFIFGLNVPSRWGGQAPFTNITLDRVCPKDMEDKALLMGGIKNGEYEKKFGELGYEMRLLNEILIEVYTEGDMNGAIFTFPIPTYNIIENFPREDELVNKLFEMTAKYGIPYFQNFIGSQFEKDSNGKITNIRKDGAYSPDAVRSMCCRLQLDLKQLEKRGGGLFGSSEMTGSIGVVTMNLARIGYNFKGDIQGYKNRIGYLMELAKESLELKRKEVSKRLENGLYPYTRRYLPSFRNHFSTIGINGMNESILNFTNGKEDITTEEGNKFACEILDFMRDKLVEYQEETGNLYNLEATPAEGTTYRFAKEDQNKYPSIIQAGTQAAPYYTNSSQIPVEYSENIFDVMDKQDNLQCKYTGGTVLHLYMGERMEMQACKQLVKKALSNYQMPYISITPTFSICPKHGYLAGEFDFCPKCDQDMGFTGKGKEKYDMEIRSKHTSTQEKLNNLS